MGTAPSLSELTAAELSGRAANFTAMARAATAADIRQALERLAIRYARLAAVQEIEEGRAVRH